MPPSGDALAAAFASVKLGVVELQARLTMQNDEAVAAEKRRVAAFEAEMRALAVSLANLSGAKRRIAEEQAKEMREASAEKNRLAKRDIEARDAEISRLKKENAAMKMSRDATLAAQLTAEKELLAAENKAAAKKADAEAARNQIKNVEAALTEKDAEVDKFKKQAEKLKMLQERERTASGAELKAAKLRISSLEKNIGGNTEAALTSSRDLLINQLRAAKEVGAAAEAKLKEATAELARLQRKYDKCKQDVARTNVKLDAQDASTTKVSKALFELQDGPTATFAQQDEA